MGSCPDTDIDLTFLYSSGLRSFYSLIVNSSFSLINLFYYLFIYLFMSLFLLAKTVTSIPKPKRSHLIYMTMKRQKKVSLVFVVLDTVLDELRIKLYARKF